MTDEPRKKPTIEDLERLLDRELSWDEDPEVEIMPNGEIRARDPRNTTDARPLKPLTFRENLGGGYGV